MGEVRTFLSPAPRVRLVQAFRAPLDNAVATARTCYSSRGIVEAEDVARRPEARDRLVASVYAAGHHTTLQHAHFQFTLENVSRQFLWSFLHAHPFYNSEQVSQRYVEVSGSGYAVPPLAGEALRCYVETIERQVATYRQLGEALVPWAAREYFARFPARRRGEQWQREVRKRAQEAARYVLPVATFAYLYHTVSGLTLLRYWRLCQQYDAPLETRLVVGEMVRLLLEHEPAYRAFLEEPLALEVQPEAEWLAMPPVGGASLIEEFDASLAGRRSLLVGRKPENEALVAQAVREVLGRGRAQLSDDDAIALALDPSRNRLLGETLNLTTLSKLGRTLAHASYSFRKKLSHAADCQNQRHRLTPASRPLLVAHLRDQPDFIRPAIVEEHEQARALFDESMRRTWAAIAALRRLGVSPEFACYLLPNAVAVRFTESADLIGLHHKLRSRLCYNAQEEIWRASLDEASQIRALEPRLGCFLQPPCALRRMAGARPLCPEGERYCGVSVWRLDLEEYQRVI